MTGRMRITLGALSGESKGVIEEKSELVVILVLFRRYYVIGNI